MGMSTCYFSISSVFAIVCSVLALILNVIAIATTKWLRSFGEEGRVEYDIGLMRHCELFSNHCGDMDELHALLDSKDVVWFRAVQILFVLATIGILACFCVSLLLLIRFMDPATGYKPLTVLGWLTFALETTPIVIFGLKGNGMFIFESVDAVLSWSFSVAIASAVFIFITNIFYAVEACKAAEVIRGVTQRFEIWSSPYSLFDNQETV
ncbi:hypothetical protein ScPMuIL_007468 [Solemya velum]